MKNQLYIQFIEYLRFSLLLLSKQFLCISRNTLLRGNTLSHTHRHQATLLHSAILYSKIERLLKVYQNLSSRQEPRGYKQTGGGARRVVLGTTWSNETTTSLIKRKLKFWSWPTDYTSQTKPKQSSVPFDFQPNESALGDPCLYFL